MRFSFFDKDNQFIYERDDALEFKQHCESFTCTGEFPPDELRTPLCGQRILWQDDDGLWQAFEITSVESDAFTLAVSINGTHMALCALRDVVLEKRSYKKKSMTYIMDDILSGTGWLRGDVIAADSDGADQYRVTAPSGLRMRSGPGTGYKILRVYPLGTIVTLVNAYSGAWYQVTAPDGRTGYMSTAWLDGDGAGVVYTSSVTIDETKWASVWTLLETAAEQAKVFLQPRVEVEGNAITGQYIDLQTTAPAYRGVRLTCGANLRSVSVEYDTTKLFTALVGVGKDDLTFKNVTWAATDEHPAKPSGQAYIEDPDATALYGRGGRPRIGVAKFSKLTDAEDLIEATWEQLKIYREPKLVIDATIADLYQLGYGGQSIRLYDAVQVIIEPLGVRVEARITALERDLVEPERTKPTIGTGQGTDIVQDILAATGSRGGSHEILIND